MTMTEHELPFQTTNAEAIQQSEPSIDDYQRLMDKLPQGRPFTVEVQMNIHCATPDHLQSVTRKLGRAVGGIIEVGETAIQIKRQPSQKQQQGAVKPEKPSPPNHDGVEIAEWLQEKVGKNAKFIHQLLGSALLNESVEWPSSSDLDRLTYRETQILTRVFHGGTNIEIGQSLYLSHQTIKSHLGRIARKLNIPDGDRTFMATAYLRHLLMQALQGIEPLESEEPQPTSM